MAAMSCGGIAAADTLAKYLHDHLFNRGTVTLVDWSNRGPKMPRTNGTLSSFVPILISRRDA